MQKTVYACGICVSVPWLYCPSFYHMWTEFILSLPSDHWSAGVICNQSVMMLLCFLIYDVTMFLQTSLCAGLQGWVMRTCTKCWSMLLPQTFVGAFGSLLYSKHGLNHFPFGCYYSCCNLLHFLLTTNKYILVHVHHSIYSREMIASHFGESGAAHCNGMCDICQRQIHYPALEYINIDVSAYAASIVTLAKDAMNLERPITLLQIGACNLCMWCDWLT